MFSFALYGRVGHGVRTASRVLAKAAFYSGYQVQCLIPYANDTQTGFIKIDKTPIASRDTAQPDYLLVFDPKMDANIKSAKDGTIIIVNSREKPKIKTKAKVKIFYVDASGIAARTSSRKRPNMVMLGALAKTFGKLPMKHLKAAAEEEGLQEMPSVEEGFKSVKK